MVEIFYKLSSRRRVLSTGKPIQLHIYVALFLYRLLFGKVSSFIMVTLESQEHKGFYYKQIALISLRTNVQISSYFLFTDKLCCFLSKTLDTEGLKYRINNVIFNSTR